MWEKEFLETKGNRIFEGYFVLTYLTTESFKMNQGKKKAVVGVIKHTRAGAAFSHHSERIALGYYSSFL